MEDKNDRRRKKESKLLLKWVFKLIGLWFLINITFTFVIPLFITLGIPLFNIASFNQFNLYFIFAAMLLFIIIIFGFIIINLSVRVNLEYQKSVIFRLGRLNRVKSAGLYFVIPFGIEREKKVDLRTITVDVESQDTVTKDSVTVGVNAVLYYRITNPAISIIRVKDHEFATSQVALTTLRNIIGQHKLDEILQERDQINLRICQIVDEVTDPWGIEIERIEIKNLEVPKGMQRAMAKEAEAIREKRARIIKAESEYESTIKLKQAAQEIAESPVALELRRMQMIAEIGTEQNTTTLMMIPSYILSAAKEMTEFISSQKRQ